MLSWLRDRLLRRKTSRRLATLPPPLTADQVLEEDPAIREVLLRTWNSGRPVIANVDDEGRIHYT